MKEHVFTIDRINLKPLYKGLGYRFQEDVPAFLKARVDELLPTLPRELRTISASAPIAKVSATSTTTGHGDIASPTFSRLAGDAEMVIYGVVTAGKEMDSVLEQCTDTVDAMILDAHGSALVEEGVDLLLDTLRREMGTNVSLPFSPGYCDYPLPEQGKLLSVFGDAPLGITCHTSSYMMSPVKTISFIAAAGSNRLDTNPCILCSLERCANRRG